MQSIFLDLVTAHDEVAPLFPSVPDKALDWRYHDNEFTLKQILVHLTHANDFYLMILDEVRATNFGVVRLHTGLPGWQRMGATDAEAMQCTATAALYACFERAFWRLLSELETLTEAEFDRSFTLYEMQADAAQTTTLHQRVVQMAAEHLGEHKAQLAETLARWQTLQNPA